MAHFDEFLAHPGIRAAQAQLRTLDQEWDQTGHRVSDVVSGPATPGQRPYQYVDLVMEGGGLHGIALVGYVYALEQLGIRFLRLAGTSAGAINALLMAAQNRQQPSSAWILEQLTQTNLTDFVDGGWLARRLTNGYLRLSARNSLRRVKLTFIVLLTSLAVAGLVLIVTPGYRLYGGLITFLLLLTMVLVPVVVNHLFRGNGLHPGLRFRDWLADLMVRQNTETVPKLLARRREGAELLRQIRRDEHGQETTVPYQSDSLCRVGIIATDVSTQTKAVLPEMAPLYWQNWSTTLNPAELVRASMSIPLFFRPWQVANLPDAGQRDGSKSPYVCAWRQFGYAGPIPEKVQFVDGGVVSNFPIDLFHVPDRAPAAPTFGVKLGQDRDKVQATGTLFGLLGATFDAARFQADFDFILRNTDYQQLVTRLEVDQYNWLDFQMSRAHQQELFEIGMRGAISFLRTFDWPAYRSLRADKAALWQHAMQLKAQREAPAEAAAAPPVFDPARDIAWPCVVPHYLHQPAREQLLQARAKESQI